MIIGHGKIWQLLTKSAESGNVSHAYLFSGQEKLGKKTLALEFSKKLLGEKVLKQVYPDFIFVAPLQKEIQISQIKDLIWRLSLKPLVSSLKVAVIDQAHCMNQEAQSALLKTLEEPLGRTVLILVSEYPETLFPTILSRVQKIKFHPLKREAIENYLKSQSLNESTIVEILEFCQGKVGVAIDLVSQPQKLAEKDNIRKKLTEIIGSPFAGRFQYVKDLITKEHDPRELLNVWLGFFRRELTLRLLNQKKGLFLSEDYSLERLKNILWQIQNVNFLLSKTNINPRLALEKLVLEL